MSILEQNRQAINATLRTPEQRQFFSPAAYGHHQVTVTALMRYVQGKCIDIGCGDMVYKELVLQLKHVTHYDGFDKDQRTEDITFVGDVHHMDAIQDASYDSAICLEVLEHVQNPLQVLSEIARIMKKGGKLVVSVPHLSRLHEEPYDFFRYTKYGLCSLLENAGFHVLTLESRGGLFSFLGHQFSTVFVCLFWHIPLLGRLTFALNKWLCVLPCYFLDKIFDTHKRFALGYTCVACKSDNVTRSTGRICDEASGFEEKLPQARTTAGGLTAESVAQHDMTGKPH
jgi:SAM-dependent methyltransferase